MKKKTFIVQLKKFAKGESKEVLDFITKFENYKIVINRDKNKKTQEYKIPKKFTKETYKDYLKTPLWQTIRKKVFDIKGKVCEGCGSNINIQVHHSVYSQRVFTGESLNGLRVVCGNCHERIHATKGIGVSLRQATNKVLSDKPLKVFLERVEQPKKRIIIRPKRKKWVGQYG